MTDTPETITEPTGPVSDLQRAELIHSRASELVAEWERKLSNVERRSDRRSGFDIVEDPEKATHLAKSRSQAEFEAQVCREALEAARARQADAATVLVRARADALQPEIDDLEQQLADHDEQVAKLVAELESCTGTCWLPQRAGDPIPSEYVTSERTRRLRAAEGPRRLQATLRLAADGGDPRELTPLDQLPAELLPGGLVVHPDIAATVEHSEQVRAEAEAWDRVVAERQAELDQAAKFLGVEAPEAYDTEGGFRTGSSWVDEWMRSHRKHGDDWSPETFEAFATIVRHAGPRCADEALAAWKKQATAQASDPEPAADVVHWFHDQESEHERLTIS